MTTEAAIALASALAQLGIATVALKVAFALKAAISELKAVSQNHESRIGKLEGK